MNIGRIFCALPVLLAGVCFALSAEAQVATAATCWRSIRPQPKSRSASGSPAQLAAAHRKPASATAADAALHAWPAHAPQGSCPQPSHSMPLVCRGSYLGVVG